MNKSNQMELDFEGKKTFLLPDQLIEDVLPKIESLATLKFLVYTFYRFQADNQKIQFITASQIEHSSNLPNIIGENASIDNILNELIQLNVLIAVESIYKNKKDILYFLNNARGRAAIRAIESNHWKPKSNIEEIPIMNRPTIFEIYENNIGALTPIIVQILEEAEKEFSYQWIEEAIQIAVKKDARNWSYIEAILKRWQKDRTNPWKGENHDEEENDPFAHIYKK